MTAKFNCQSYQNGNFYSGGSTTKASCGTGKITTVCICRTDTMIMNTTPRASSASTQQWAKYFVTFIMVIQTLWMIKTCNTCSFIPVNFYSNTFVVKKRPILLHPTQQTGSWNAAWFYHVQIAFAMRISGLQLFGCQNYLYTNMTKGMRKFTLIPESVWLKISN